jgi:hypothetical protein
MATKIGPKTVSQRDRSKALVFCIDAANSDSYGGEPTTNVFPDPEPAGNFLISQSAGSAGTISYGSEDGIPHLVISNTTASSGTDYPRVNFNDLTSTVTDGFSISFEAKADDEGKVLKFALYSSGSTKTTQTANLTTEWKKFTFNNITTGFTLDDGYLRPNETYSGNKYIRRIQVEQKTSSTPFTATSRTASNAVKNISGVGALGTTLTGTFAAYGQELFKPTNRKVLASFNINQGHIGGAYWDFDGSDECIVIPYADDSSLDLARGTIIAWFNASGGSQNGVIVGWGSAGTNNYGNIAITSNWTGGYADESLAYNRYKGSASNIQMYIRKGHNFYADSTWHCVAVTSHGGTSDLGRIYIDGELQTITTTSSIGDEHPFMNIRDGEAKFLNIGRRPYGGGINYFNGEIANTMIWSSSLTSKEIKDIYIAQKGRFGK